MRAFIDRLERTAIEGGVVSEAEAARLLDAEGGDVYELFAAANRIARHFKGWDVELCGIVNAKSGRCPENCAFCSQSAHSRTDAPTYPLKGVSEMVSASNDSAAIGADRFGIVTSGTAMRDADEIAATAEAVREIRRRGQILPCVSLGNLSEDALRLLQEAGIDRYHHNLETARSYFPSICTTHDYEDDVATVVRAKRLGLAVCSGGIFGVGESRAQRAELAVTLRELDVDSVPINFLVPVPGTPLADTPPLPALEALKIVAMFRFVLPRATIKVCAGRDTVLGDMASWIFHAGANAMMIGDYLTTAGRAPDRDLAMIRELGFRPVGEA